MSQNNNSRVWIVFVLLLSVFLAREMDYIRRSSQTYDEHFYIAYGASLLNTWDFRLRKDKTSFIPLLSAAPLLLTKAEFPKNSEDWLKSDTRELPKTGHWASARDKSHVWKFTLDYLYANRISPDKMLFLSRLPVIFLSMLLAFFVFKWTRELYGDIPALIASGIYTNCPNILAGSGLVTEDIALSLFVFTTVYFFHRFYRTGLRRNIVFSGIAMGFALNTKYSAVILFPAVACLAVFEELRAADKKVSRPFCNASAVFLTAAVTLAAFYRFVDIREYLTGFSYAAEYIKRGQMTFLAGKYSATGFWNYFLYAFFLKTPLPVIFSLVLVLLFGDFSLKNILKRGNEVYLSLVPVALFTAASFSPLQIGLRHILPVYPFLFVLCGSVYSVFSGKFRWILAGLGAWLIIASAGIHPHYLSYFNELAGGPSGGGEYLLDSNLDWGQDLKKLKRYVKENEISDVILSYYGSSSPGYFGRDFQDLFSFGVWGEKNHINSSHPAREILAISVTNLQGLYLSRLGVDTFFWLKDKRPKDVIGNTIYIYDITKDAEAHKRLAHIYFISGMNEHAAHECERANELEPGSPIVGFISALSSFSPEKTGPSGLRAMARLLDDKTASDRVFEGLKQLINNEYAAKIYSATTYSMGIAMMRQGMPRQAERMLETAIILDRRNLYAYINLGAAYMKSAKYELALGVYSAAESAGAENADLFYNKAVALYYLKDLRGAGIYLGKALSKEPGMPQAKQLLNAISSKL